MKECKYYSCYFFYAFNLLKVIVIMHFLWKLSHWTGCVSINIAKHNFDDHCTDVGLEVATYILH